MTAYKSILAYLSDAATARQTLALALKVAVTHAARLRVLHVRPDATNAVPLVGEGMSGAMVEEMLALAETRAANRANELHGLFEQALADTPANAVWVEEVGQEEDLLALVGRLTDLVVMARPSPDSESAPLLALNAVLMESGRPLLLVPERPVQQVGRHVAVLWNGSAEASRAVTFAMPFLAGAEKVSIFSASEARSLAQPQALADYLACHGIKAETRVMPAGGTVETTLLGEVEKAGADMMVMGAYTHSRLRQLILGGVTRHILLHATLPVLMCH